MANKVVLISFANSTYKPSLIRLKKEVSKFTSITESHFFTEKDLDDEFKKDFHPFIYRRGYGYWKWKVYFCKKTLDKLSLGDILIWSDAGNVFNSEAEHRFLEYLELARTSPSGILAFQDEYMEKQYTKADCLAYFNALNNKNIIDSNQFWAGCCIFKKTINSTELIDRWYDISINHFDLITDKKSEIPNLQGFIEHRHDQSIFSILAKQYDIKVVSHTERCIKDGKLLKNLPIQAKRSKQQSITTNVKRKLLIPLRYIIGLYLIHIKGFYFKNRTAW